jgi:hypothetical protein
VKNLLIFSTLLIGGCATTTSHTIKTVPIEIEVEAPPEPSPLQLLVPHWYVVTESNIQEFLEKVEKVQDAKPVFYAVIPLDYEKISRNMQEFKRLIQAQQTNLTYYKQVTKPQDWATVLDEKRKYKLKPTVKVVDKTKPGLVGRIKNLFKREESL